MRVIIAAGGTAGHINPGLAIADKIMDVFPESEILFVGTPWGMEATLVKKSGFNFAPMKMAGIQRSLTVKNIARNVKAVYYYSNAKNDAKKLIKDFQPEVVIGTGGYVSAPILKAAAKLGIVTANHESNSLPGMSTKMLSKVVDRVFVADEAAIKSIPAKEKCVVTGNPIRSHSKIMERAEARKALGLPEGYTILSFGGSLGSNKITEGVIRLLKWENTVGGINHIHAYGKNGKDLFEAKLAEEGVTPSKERTIIKEYIHNMYTCYSAADIIISRSGSMTQTELKAIGRASVQIPWPGAAENHQYYNALSMEKAGAARLIEDKDLTAEKLLGTVQELLDQPERLRDMESAAKRMATHHAADLILGEILDLLK